MEQGFRSPAAKRRSGPTSAALSTLILVFAASVVADTNVYRCVAPNGKIEFRQTVCTGSDEEEEVKVEDRKTGWEPAKTKIEKKSTSSTKSKPRKRDSDKEKAARIKQEKQCRKKQQMIEEINARLRRGYKSATGEKLRRRRRSYEGYIRRFCK